MTTEQEPKRRGEYRDEAYEYYGSVCQDCNEKHPFGSLHVHFTPPIESEHHEGRKDTITLLCKNCHLNRHRNNDIDIDTAQTLTEHFANKLEHKHDEFINRVMNRVSLDSALYVPEAEEQNGYWRVEGLEDGDYYDSYRVNWEDTGHLEMCSCYSHSFGMDRARTICTHVGCAIITYALDIADKAGVETAIEEVEEIGEELNDSVEEYIKKREGVRKAISDLELEERFETHMPDRLNPENWVDRGRREAVRTEYQGKSQMVIGDRTVETRQWNCFGSDCGGCLVSTFTDDNSSYGMFCSKTQKRYKRCPGKIGAALLHHYYDTQNKFVEKNGEVESQ